MLIKRISYLLTLILTIECRPEYNELDPYLNNVQEIIVRSYRGIQYVEHIARKYGPIEVREVPSFENTYSLLIPVANKYTRSLDIIKDLAADVGVEFTEPQIPFFRHKRGYLSEPSSLPLNNHYKVNHLSANSLDEKILGIRQMEPMLLTGETGGAETARPIPDTNNLIKKAALRFNDKLFMNQWYITNEMNSLTRSHKIMEAWSHGFTGKGITVAILDDGLEHTHSDLKSNFNPIASYDFNDDDFDPSPRPGSDNSHGTRCAGEVAMSANNFLCGVGIAFNARVAGIKLLDGAITDAIEGRSLAYKHQIVDIYSASWGPADNGETVEGPKRLAQEALLRGVTYGRRGRGSIYVWASGNGGNNDDNCNCDGYASSIYTLSIGSASQNGSFPWYGERCASTIAVTYSSGGKNEGKVATTDIGNSCTNDHTGTSAAAPIAAGIIALVLEANPNLNWRDVQHLVVWTSQVLPLKNNPGWKRNGADLLFNERFGFGLLDADLMTRWAKAWPSVPPQRFCNVGLLLRDPLKISSESKLRVAFNVSGCRGSIGEVNYVEHVQLMATIDYPLRGALEIELVSPSNTSSTLLDSRKRDKSSEGFQNWLFTSVHFWAERPYGYWTLEIRDNSPKKRFGTISKLSLLIFGTREKPYHMSRKRHYYKSEESFDLSLESLDKENFDFLS
ncbi:neuroendocrine convertase 1 [Tetranychus urticae]|uniref:furin n=1 Tax=Tetranychus urticae TaxID=32264 RepID=T1K8C4_TETUR|nr:neuroendocrine convertase 1 [Tetranychus urticae]